MHPHFIDLPGGFSIKTYGFCLMLGFLTAVWLSMKRAEKLRSDPEMVLNLSFLALVFGVAGSRIFYVIHYWDERFANAPNKLFAIVDVRQGGLEFLGGFLGAAIAILAYAAIKRISVRLYLDILTPGVAWGLAIGRIGCFFNGCCFGGVCLDEDHHHDADHIRPAYAWAMEFPYGSPAHLRQWENRQVTIPAELIIAERPTKIPITVPESVLSMSVEKRYKPLQEYRTTLDRYEQAKLTEPDSPSTQELRNAAEQAKNRLKAHVKSTYLSLLESAKTYPSRIHSNRPISDSEIEQLAAKSHSLPVHPTQLYSSLHAFVLSILLTVVLYARKRHGLVFGLYLVLYPVARFLLEGIRADNPHDTAGFTISQFVSLSLFTLGVIYLFVIYNFLPQRSPYATVYVPPEEDEE